MKTHPDRFPAESFFLTAAPGKRFCIYHAPPPDRVCRGAFIYVHPFAEEMNRSRRVVTLQARQFAENGYAVLIIDLFGCGDSTGEFADATWEIWKADLGIAEKWLIQRLHTQIGLWGLRLGALLAMDFARHAQNRITSIILWQPVINGKSFMTQFLRLRAVSSILADGQKPIGTSVTTNAMRSAMLDGETFEIAGYDISPALTSAIDALDAKTLWVNTAPIYWFDISGPGLNTIPSLTTEVVNEWRRQNADLHQHAVLGQPFWALQDISDAPALLTVTTSLLDEGSVMSK